jgi:hypothetical protein
MGYPGYRRGLAARPPASVWLPYGCKLEGVCALLVWRDSGSLCTGM